MKETLIPFTPSEKHSSILTLDKNPDYTYRTNRGVHTENGLGFDFFEYLWQIADAKPDRKIEVLSGGCGMGSELVDFKKGKAVNPNKKDSQRIFRGLQNRIRTTGVTLFGDHLEIVRTLPEDVRPDEMIIGPLEQHKFDRQYDFIYDHFGAAFYFPEEVIPIYGQILVKDRLAYVILLSADILKSRNRMLCETNGLRIESETRYQNGNMEFLLRKT